MTMEVPDGVGDPFEAIPRPRQSGVGDARIEAVLAVLAGESIERVAARLAIDPTLLPRWVSAFVDAGTAKVTNRPDTHEARHRDRFLAAFSFEVRTPLAVAQGWTELLAEADHPDPSFTESVQRLEATLADLDDRLSGVELLVSAALGGLQVDPTEITVGELCGHLGAGEIGGEGPALLVQVDPHLCGRIMSDLWQAAGLRPLPRSRRIEAEVVGPWVELRVVRDADPMEIDTLRALYEPFDRDHLATGVTTGLYLARALTVAHGGTMGLDQDDHGAVMWVRVPLITQHHQQAPRTAPEPGGTP